MEVSLQKWGNSSAIRLPKPVLKTAEIGEFDTLEIIAKKNEIIIRKVERKHITFAERIKNWDGVYEAEDISDIPAGEEIFWNE